MGNSAKITIKELAKSAWRLGTYDIIQSNDGKICLNGLWSNNNNETMNEIARKMDRKKGIVGQYKVTWIQPNNICKERILIINEINSRYYFEWKETVSDPKLNYFGIGIKMNNQLIVFYLEQN